MMRREIWALLHKDLVTELRMRHALGALGVYVIATVFICYLSFRQSIEPVTWNALFWIIMLFAAINAVARSFLQESQGRLLYYYTLASPQGIILSKVIYNSILLIVIGLLCYLVYALMLGNVVRFTGVFLSCVVLGAIGLSATLTLMSAIAAQTNGNLALMAILSFPVLCPILLLLLKASWLSIRGTGWDLAWRPVLALLALDVMIGALSFMLFSHLWRD